MKDKISEINALDRRISKLKDFLKVCESSGPSSYKERDGKPKENYFGELSLSAYCWTGSDNPRWTRELTNKDDIELLVDAMKDHLNVQIKKLEADLSGKLT